MLTKIRQKPEEYRKKLALGISSGVLFVMLLSWVYLNGFLGFGEPIIAEKNSNNTSQTASVALSDSSISPFDSSKSTFSGILNSIADQYHLLVETIGSVMVPFVRGIEVYEKSK